MCAVLGVGKSGENGSCPLGMGLGLLVVAGGLVSIGSVFFEEVSAWFLGVPVISSRFLMIFSDDGFVSDFITDACDG